MINPWQPTLIGQRIEIHPLKVEHYSSLYAAASDPLIWELHPDQMRHTPERFNIYFQTGIASQGAFIVLDKTTQAVIGSSRFADHNPQSSTVELGYTFLARKYWGGDYNLEMKTLMLDHAFKHVNTVYFVVGRHNYRSQRAMEKIGGVLLKELVQLPLRDLKDSVVFQIKKSDWYCQ